GRHPVHDVAKSDRAATADMLLAIAKSELMKGPYLEQLLSDSKELRKLRSTLSINSIVDANDTDVKSPAVTQAFSISRSSNPPVYMSEAACPAFASRLCKYLQPSDHSAEKLPELRYTDESTLSSLLDIDIQWPSLAYAQLLVQTALGHVNPSFHLALRKDTLDVLQTIYQKGTFDDPALQCKYFALFALGNVYTTPRDSSRAAPLPGASYFAKAHSLILFIPERASIIHVESLLCIAFYCQFMNRFHSGYRLVGTAMRVCTSLGLHRPIAESQSLEREHCLRLWWTVYVLDRFWGQRLGSPAQIDDKDIHLDLPSESVSMMHREQFADSTYQIATVGLAKICGSTIKEIYSRPHSPARFLQHEQNILLQLRQWARSLPESMKLQQGKSNPTHLVQAHLQFNHCLIVAIRPVLLYVLYETRPNHSDNCKVSSIATTLSEACIHTARQSLAMCVEEWTTGAVAVLGYSFPSFIFSSALILMISSILPFGNPSDLTSAESGMEILRVMSLSEDIMAETSYERLRYVRQCFENSTVLSDPSFVDHKAIPGEPTAAPNAGPSFADLKDIHSPDQSSAAPYCLPHTTHYSIGPSGGSAPISDASYTVPELALYQPDLQAFLDMDQSDMNLDSLEDGGLFADIDVSFLWPPDPQF
ncbi:hypothetical protein N7474_004941, partial [Penicillium riverlandense]|uniref:uncharacterized protein n=1 Tax=Penicillium riverlandense TaxID=1903569 RepID=UPI0025489704